MPADMLTCHRAGLSAAKCSAVKEVNATFGGLCQLSVSADTAPDTLAMIVVVQATLHEGNSSCRVRSPRRRNRAGR
jgi:hypothetical protein